MSKLILSFTVVVIATLGGFFANSPAHALPVVGFQAGRIIDDATLTAKDSMNASQIQSFLNSKVPICDTNGTQPSEFGGGTRAQWGAAHGHPAPFICLKDYSEGGKSAAQIIYDKAQTYLINPQVLIVLLQKEQGLVTDTWPLDTQYRTATGYGCPDTAPCDSQYYGLTNQLDWSAKMFRAIMNASPTWYTPYVLGNNFIRWNPAASCGGTTVNITNRATQALYNYTPYQPNQAALNAGYGTGDSCSAYGNRNFYLYFTDWFGTTINGQYPSPLYRGITSGSIYVIISDKKFYVPSYDILVNYGLQNQPVTSVADSFLSTLTDAGTLTNIGRKQYDPNGTIFFYDDGKAYAIQSPEQCSAWALDCFNPSVAMVLPNELMDRYMRSGGSLPNVIRVQDGTLFLMEGGKKRPIVGFYSNRQYSSGAPYIKAHNLSQPYGKVILDDRYIVKFGDSPTIYLHDRGKLHPILDMKDFDNWSLYSLGGSNVPLSYDADPLPRTDPLRPIGQSVDGKKYLVANGMKYSIESRASDFTGVPITTFGYDGSQLDRLPSGGPVKDLFRAQRSGEFFTVTNGTKRTFASFSDMNSLGFNPTNSINAPQQLADSLVYAGLSLPNNKIIKVAGTTELRLIRNGGYLYLGRTDYPGIDYSNGLNVDMQTGSLYPYLGVYTP